MKTLKTSFLWLILISVLTCGCKKCDKKEQEKYYTTTDTPPVQQSLVLGDGFFGDCSKTKTGTNDLFKIKVRVRGISGVDGNGTPITYLYRPTYVWAGVSNSNSSYTNTIEVPGSGGFFVDVSVESNGCVKCCTNPTSCPTSFGNIELDASLLVNGNITVPNPLVIPANLFVKTCY